VRQVGGAWTSGELYRKYAAVDGLAPRKSGYIDGKTLEKHVYSVKMPDGRPFGDWEAAKVTHEHARIVMGAQRPEEQALQTRRHTYNRIRQVFDFAESPLRLRPDGSNPFTKRLRPRKVKGVDREKALQYFYPSEAVQLCACTAVLLARRVFKATAMATGFDVSTLPLLSCADYDPKNRTLQEVRPKVGKPVFVFANPAWLFDLLDAWRELSGAPEADADREVLKAALIFPPEALGYGGRESDGLQADMKLANLTRAALVETTETSHRMRFHDLRATFETARRAGWDQRDIDARTGHASKAMAERYDRGARSLAELRETPFPDLARAIPEVRAVLEKRDRKTAPNTPPVAHAVAQNRGVRGL
jgi:integrase